MDQQQSQARGDLMRAVRFHALGGPEVLQIEEQAVPEPGPGEIRLQIEAVGLNHSEGAYVRGTYVEQPRLPSKLGYEAVGIVNSVGEGVEFKLDGQAVVVDSWVFHERLRRAF